MCKISGVGVGSGEIGVGADVLVQPRAIAKMNPTTAQAKNILPPPPPPMRHKPLFFFIAISSLFCSPRRSNIGTYPLASNAGDGWPQYQQNGRPATLGAANQPQSHPVAARRPRAI